MNNIEAKEIIFLAENMKTITHDDDDNEVDSLYILRKDVLDFVDKIYEDNNNKVCDTCRWANKTDTLDIFICGSSVCVDLDEYGQFVVTSDFGCNKWEAKNEA